jgi:hypothetical protein
MICAASALVALSPCYVATVTSLAARCLMRARRA